MFLCVATKRLRMWKALSVNNTIMPTHRAGCRAQNQINFGSRYPYTKNGGRTFANFRFISISGRWRPLVGGWSRRVVKGLVMCARREGCACGRGLESGFVSTIYAHRQRHRGALANRGVYSYIEKPGWDFQASSRVPLAGRATAPIATYTTGDVVPWKVSRSATSSDAARTPRNRRRRDD